MSVPKVFSAITPESKNGKWVYHWKASDGYETGFESGKREEVEPLNISDLGVPNKKIELMTTNTKEHIGNLTRDTRRGIEKGVSNYFFNSTRKTEKIGKGAKIDLHCSVKIRRRQKVFTKRRNWKAFSDG